MQTTPAGFYRKQSPVALTAETPAEAEALFGGACDRAPVGDRLSGVR